MKLGDPSGHAVGGQDGLVDGVVFVKRAMPIPSLFLSQ